MLPLEKRPYLSIFLGYLPSGSVNENRHNTKQCICTLLLIYSIFQIPPDPPQIYLKSTHLFNYSFIHSVWKLFLNNSFTHVLNYSFIFVLIYSFIQLLNNTFTLLLKIVFYSCILLHLYSFIFLFFYSCVKELLSKCTFVFFFLLSLQKKIIE